MLRAGIVTNLPKEEFERDFKLKDTNWFYKGMFDIWAAFLEVSLKGFDRTGRALDLGCGAGGKMLHLRNYAAKVYGLDLSMDALRFTKERSSVCLNQASAENIPYKDGSFSLMNAFDIIEHIEDDLGALKEMNRVMAKGGFLVIAVPAFGFLWSQHDIANFHKRRYTACDLKVKLEKAGFEVARMTYANFFLFPFVAAIRLVQYGLLRPFLKVERTRVESLPPFLNSILVSILDFESRIVKKTRLPFGVAVMCVARKKESVK
ncbi:MAG: class I SAM-dependent methyltransferase [Candidatus Omnitrophica bacterium]|nr:class I SAM-dependent methyltransferase [Candidatus Omnitrophota bacterium]